MVPKYNDDDHIDVLPGACMDDTDSVRIDWTLTKTKELTGAVADTIYNIFAIKNPGTGATDVHLDTNMVSPTLPSGYTFKRWLGWCRTDASSNIIPADWVGNGIGPVEMWFRARQTVATGLGSSSYISQSLAAFIPAGVDCSALFGGTTSSGTLTYVVVSVDGVNAKTMFGAHQTENTVGELNELYSSSAANPDFVQLLANSIFIKTYYSARQITLLLRSVRYWR